MINKILIFLIVLIIALAIYYFFFMEDWIKPLSGKVSSAYGYRTHPVTGVKSFHNGIDIPAKTGTKIVSPRKGIVQSVYESDKGGKQIIILHDNKWLTGYAHLNKFLVKKGDEVKQGQAIAEVGNTGKSTGAHLHFTMKNEKGENVDPMTIFNYDLK